MTRIAVFSDLHASAADTREVLAQALHAGAERTVCLGDIVGYGPEPSVTIALLQDAGTECLLGNHDDAVAFGGASLSDLNPDARAAAAEHAAMLSEDELLWLRERPLVLHVGALAFTHASLPRPESFRYVTSDRHKATHLPGIWVHTLDLGRELWREDIRIAFVGHTHAPLVYRYLGPERCSLQPPSPASRPFPRMGERLCVNVGSASLPRTTTGRPKSARYRRLVLVDTHREELRFVRF